MIPCLLAGLLLVNACSGFILFPIHENKMVLLEFSLKELNGSYEPLKIVFLKGNHLNFYLQMERMHLQMGKPREFWHITKHLYFVRTRQAHQQDPNGQWLGCQEFSKEVPIVDTNLIDDGETFRTLDLLDLDNIDVRSARFRFKLASKRLRIWEGKDYIGEVNADFQNEPVKFGLQNNPNVLYAESREYMAPHPVPATLSFPQHRRLEGYKNPDPTTAQPCAGDYCTENAEIEGTFCPNEQGKVSECYAHLNFVILLKEKIKYRFEVQVQSTERLVYVFSLESVRGSKELFESSTFCGDSGNTTTSGVSDNKGGGIIEISFQIYQDYLIVYRRRPEDTLRVYDYLGVNPVIEKIHIIGDGDEILEAVNGQQEWARIAFDKD